MLRADFRNRISDIGARRELGTDLRSSLSRIVAPQRNATNRFAQSAYATLAKGRGGDRQTTDYVLALLLRSSCRHERDLRSGHFCSKLASGCSQLLEIVLGSLCAAQSCDFENPKAIKFCGNCGASLKHVCAKCGAENPPKFNFCGECGKPLNVATDG
jgi:hypothetical protein